jgi:hypothetical protein
MLSRLFGGHRPPAGIETEDWASIRRDFAPLDAFEPGLGDLAARFVAVGEHENVLDRIDRCREAAHRAVRYQENPNPSAYSYMPRPLWFARGQKAWSPGVMQRYGIALARLEQHPLDDWLFPGSQLSPAWLRVVVAALVHDEAAGRPAGVPVASPIGKAAALQYEKVALARAGPDFRQWRSMIDFAGERYTCLLDVVFSSQAYVCLSWRRDESSAIAGLADFMREDPAARAMQIARLPANGRDAALRWLAREELVRGPFFDMAFAMALDSSRRVREAAFLALGEADKVQLEERIASSFAVAPHAARIELARLASQALGAGARGTLAAMRNAADGAPDVIAAIDLALRGASGAVSDAQRQDSRKAFVLAESRALVESFPMQPEAAADDEPVQAEAPAPLREISTRRSRAPADWTEGAVPDAGLDEFGILDLPIGDRHFTAKLEPDLKLCLFNADGKPIKKLPSAAGADEADYKTAKKTLSNAKKETKQVVKVQSRRLYGAMCAERVWPAEDWRSLFLEHPILQLMAQRIAWIGLDDDGVPIASFRPIEDLTLTDAQDDEVELDFTSGVRIAHRSALEDEDAEAWGEHFDDNDIEPLFDQFSRPALALAAHDGDQAAIEDRKGWLIEAYKLRMAATKLGYSRAPAADGGFFTAYEKLFEELGVCAIIEFTGNSLPEHNRTVALIALRFAARAAGKRRNGRTLLLSETPPVMLSETWNDLHEMAAAGSGFAENWQERSRR